MAADLRVQQVPQFQLALTPALQLSLKILQLPLMQLDAFLQQELENNPMLELTGPVQEGNGKSEAPEVSNGLDESTQDLWRSAGSAWTADGDEESRQPEPVAPSASLHEHLSFQIRCMGADALQASLAERLVGWLETDGYLRTPLEEIAQAEHAEPQALQNALALIQRLDPAGVGARDLRECLLIQLEHHHERDSLPWRILHDHFELFLKRRAASLAARLKAPLREIEDAWRRITHLDPRPARGFSTAPTPYQTPDLIVRKSDGVYQVELNDAELPRLGISRYYRTLLRQRDTAPEAKEFIRERVRQGMWLVKAIRQRHETLLSIGRCLVDLQQDYFQYGISRLKPLTQQKVASHVGCHASTVSRAVAGKVMQTPFGSMPMESFFGGGIADPQQADRRMSPKSIHAELQELITHEDPRKPMSDQALLTALTSRGYPVARRTIAKYRTELRILPAHLRRRDGVR